MSAPHSPSQLPPRPQSPSPLAARAEQRLQDWERLRAELQTLHAELEYLRLMLKVNPPQ